MAQIIAAYQQTMATNRLTSKSPSGAKGSSAAATSPKSGGGSKKQSKRVSAAVLRKTSGVLEYLQVCLPRSELLTLYEEESRGRFVCRAILQRLPQVSQQMVIRLSCCGGSFPKTGVQVWIKQPLNAYLDELYQWAIVTENGSNSNTAEVSLTREFGKALKSSLVSLDASPWTPLTQTQIQSKEVEAKERPKMPVTVETLERYTQHRWDAVLHFLVGTPNISAEPPPAVVHFLLQTGLMQPDPEYKGRDINEAPLVITEKGYDFMLQDHSRQVWHFVMQYLNSMASQEKYKELRQEALLFLICLSFGRYGEAYSSSSLRKDGKMLMKDFALFGLLYVRKIGKQSVFYPTRVSMQVLGGEERHAQTNGGSSSSSSMWSQSSKALDECLAHPRPQQSSHLAIIVQTNFQLAAYTTSELHVSMLGLFCDVQTIRRLPNVVFMVLTRESVKAAFALGIQAGQILKFLEKHAHPKLRSASAGAVPSNVEDQIWLWDRERHRVQFTEVYQHQCLMPGEFQAVQQYTMDTNAHVWSSETRKILMVNYRHAERVQNFCRQWRAKTAARQAETGGV